MDTTLAGIGTEKQFPNEIDDPASGISLTPDQDSSQWNSFDPSSQGFAMDVDRSNVNAQPQVSLNNRHSSGLAGQQSVSASSSASSLRARQNSLNILADVASNQVPPDRPGQPPRPQLSNAPQTKAEQQRQALQKFSKAIVGEIQSAPSADAVDLENVVLRVLCGATSASGADAFMNNASSGSAYLDIGRSGFGIEAGMTKSEALRATQAISNLIKQSGSQAGAPRPRRPSKEDPTNKLQCEHCDALLSRSCDLKKHMKRHTKPYGCTYPKCHKRFGAKSDWKRHENSQHFQLESFRCCLPLPSLAASVNTPRAQCTGFYQRPELFREHLVKDHKITPSDQMEEMIKRRRIGKNGQGQFWCGFCGTHGEIVKLKERRNAAWDERFDHIDYHFSKDKRGIEEWVCVEAGKRKGDVMRDMDKTNFDDDEDGVGETDDTNSPPDEPQATVGRAMAVFPPSAQHPQPNPRKRQLPMDDAVDVSAQKRRKRDLNRFCVSTVHSFAQCISMLTFSSAPVRLDLGRQNSMLSV